MEPFKHGVYIHNKSGNYYRTLFSVIDSGSDFVQNGREMIVYIGLYGNTGAMFARSRVEFEENVYLPSISVGDVPRFKFVESV